MDHDDQNYNVIPGTRRQELDLHDADDPPPDTARNSATQAAKDMCDAHVPSAVLQWPEERRGSLAGPDDHPQQELVLINVEVRSVTGWKYTGVHIRGM